jgi:hypothetical protein
MRRIEGIAIMMALAAATPAMAQGRGNGGVPPGQRPPAGMCRVWIDGVPPGRQPAPTDCAIAERYVPRNGRVIYGDNTVRRDRSIYTSNGDVYRNHQTYPTNQQCVQRTDRSGVLRTYCDDNRDRDRDRDGILNSRVNRDARHRMDEQARKHKKAKKHDRDDRDHDGDRDHDRDRSDWNRARTWDRHRD